MPNQLRLCLRFVGNVGVFSILAAFGLTLAQPVHAQPKCAEDTSVKKLRTQYNGLESIQGKPGKIKEIKDVEETFFGPAPPSFNQYANSNDRFLNVRWCKATILLNDGQLDIAYWFLADEQQRNEHSVVSDHCSTKHNTLDETCAKWRDHR